jgi:hypothetical protein
MYIDKVKVIPIPNFTIFGNNAVTFDFLLEKDKKYYCYGDHSIPYLLSIFIHLLLQKLNVVGILEKNINVTEVINSISTYGIQIHSFMILPKYVLLNIFFLFILIRISY